MALRQIRVQGDTILEKECRKVDEVTPKIRDLIEDMIETMYDANGVGLAAPDRKSTRLNSSHQIISYAVFCLKKIQHTAGI